MKPAAQRVASRYVVRDPKILGGEPTIVGSRVPVRAIVQTYRFDPHVEHLCEAFPMLAKPAIEDALTFYQLNQQEIDRYIAENDDGGEG